MLSPRASSLRLPARLCPARRRWRLLLALGVLTRVIVFSYLAPFNNDAHMRLIVAIADEGRLPASSAFAQAYQPPLYYLLAAPIWRAMHNAKALQSLSLVFSLGTLWALAAILRKASVVPARARLWCLALVAFHPQFVLNSLFVSNDSLCVLLGACTGLAMLRASRKGRLADRVLVGACVGLGLLTKHVFLAYLPVAIAFLALAGGRRAPLGRRVLEAAVIGALASALGCWKYVQNARDFGDPFVNNLDFGFYWVREQRPTVLGWRSLVDLNLVKLTAFPLFCDAHRHAPPSLIYASFWYHFFMDSKFVGNTAFTRGVGRLTYWAALGPTLAMLAGAGRAAWRSGRMAWASRASERHREAALGRLALLGCLAANVAMVVGSGLHYDVWSVFQGRLLFPACAGWAMAFGGGLDWILRRGARWRLAARVNLFALFALFLLFAGAGVFHSFQAQRAAATAKQAVPEARAPAGR